MSRYELLHGVALTRLYQAGTAQLEALGGISLSIGPGDFIVITGPSGSGKSTLLNLLSGLDRPTGGCVYFQGTALSEFSPPALARLRNESFGFIFQSPHLLPDRTVLANVALPFQYGSRIAKSHWMHRCQELLAYVGLDELADRYPSTLSGGEMQRVVFARALVRRPRVIFADEPTGSLDADNASRILNMLEDQASDGCAVLLVTHDPGVMAHGHKIIRLDKARENVPART